MTLKLFASITIFFLSALITSPSFAQSNNTSSSYKPGQTFRDCPDCPEMVVIPAGSFMMGSPDNEQGRYPEEGPQKQVNIHQFAAGKFDITKGQWAAFVLATKRTTIEGCEWSFFDSNKVKASWRYVSFTQDDNHPVVCISWNDAQDYIQWLSNMTGFKYRLLTEAEWEYAARAGTTTAYSWGVSASHEYANYGNDSCCSGLASGRDKWVYSTSPVGAFPPNAFGLYDMNGNVMQWVEDCFNYPYSNQPTDGSAYNDTIQLKITGEFSDMSGTSSCSYHILRGGDFNDSPRFIRSASRNFAPPPGAPTLEKYRNAGIGFRVARIL